MKPSRSAVARARPAPRSPKPSPHEAFDREDLYERRKLALVQAAIRAFNRNGFHATSMDAIAAEVGLTKGALYHYYRGKSELLYDCLCFGLEETRQVAERVGSEGGLGAQKLERFLRLQLQTLAGSAGSGWLIADLSVLPERQRDDVRSKSRAVDAAIQAFVADGVADGSLAPTEPKIAECFLIGALNGLPRWYSPQGRLSSEELASIFIRIVFEGLRSPR